MRVPPRASPAEADKEIRRDIPMPVKAMYRMGRKRRYERHFRELFL